MMDERIPEPVARALMREILGATLVVTRSPGLSELPVEGTVIDESLGLLTLRVPGRRRPLRIPKAGMQGTILLGEAQLPIRGDFLRMRPEDRTKRLAPRGRRGVR